jgi:hypothetical protein
MKMMTIMESSFSTTKIFKAIAFRECFPNSTPNKPASHAPARRLKAENFNIAGINWLNNFILSSKSLAP